MLKQKFLPGSLFVMCVFVATAQTKVPCYSGAADRSCTPAERLAKAKTLATARTAAIIVEATQDVSCGDGSNGCIAKDHDAIAIVERAVGESELWQNLTKAEPQKADILLYPAPVQDT